MRISLFAVAAAVASLATAARAELPREVQDWLADANRKLETRLEQAGLHPDGRPVRVQFSVDGDGRLGGARVTLSSGSRDLDEQVVKALGRAYAQAPPAVLSGRTVSFRLLDTPA